MESEKPSLSSPRSGEGDAMPTNSMHDLTASEPTVLEPQQGVGVPLRGVDPPVLSAGNSGVLLQSEPPLENTSTLALEPPLIPAVIASLPDSQRGSAKESHREVSAAKPWSWKRRCLALLWLPFQIVYRLFQFLSLVALLAVASSIPILQLASLGYMLEIGRRISNRDRRESWLPGIEKATRLGVIALGASLSWLPVWLVSDYAYTAGLIEEGGRIATRWHIAAWIITIAWLTHVTWAALRGGKWYHFLWPAPIRFVKQIWRPSTWKRAEDGVWNYTVGLQLPRLMWLGLRGAIVAVCILALPAVMMIIGIQANQQPIRVLIGLAGGVLMMVALMYLPFLQIQMARENRLRSGFDVRMIRTDFKRAPWAFFVAFFVTLAMALPLFLFRIESLPKELLWLPCFFFVLLTIPARALTGWALRRGHRDIPKRLWISRWMAWSLQLASVPIYVLFLYLASIASWDGRLIFFIQHAFLVPVPFSGN